MRVAVGVLAVLVVVSGLVACGRGAVGVGSSVVDTGERATLAERLRGHVERLCEGGVGGRSVAQREAYFASAAYLRAELEGMGYGVREVAVGVDGFPPNLEVVVDGRGGDGGGELGCVVVGAHYDTEPGTPGADDNASGVAGVVEVARALRGASLARDVRLVLFPNEETPYFGTPAMGSLSYAWDLKRRGVDVSAMISVEMIGYFSEEAGSQSYPALPDGMLGEVLGFEPPTVGDFVAVVGRPEERGLVGEVSSLMRPATAEAGGVGVLEAVLPGWVRGVGSSDHWAFWRAGFGAVMVTDTSYYRNPHYHEASDTPETLDYGRMASVVRGIEAAVRGLAGGGG